MKKSKLFATIVALGLIGGAGYVVSQQNTSFNQEKNELVTPGESTEHTGEVVEGEVTETMEPVAHENGAEVAQEANQEVNLDETDNKVMQKIEAANAGFEADGMTNLYPNLRTSQKKKWLKRIEEGNYFEEAGNLQYEINGLYEIGKDQYYIVGSAMLEEGTPEVFELALMQEGDKYFVTQANYPVDNILSSEEVMLYKKADQEESNVVIEYNKVRKLEGVDEYVSYLEDVISENQEQEVATKDDGIKSDTTKVMSIINDAAKSQVTQYVQYAIEGLSATSTIAKENTIDIDAETLEQMKESMTSAKDKFDTLLSQNDISFNKSLNTILKLQVEETNFKKPIYIQLPESFDDLEDVTGVRIVIDENSYVYINGEDLESLAGLKIKIERLKDKKSYEITFLGKQDEVIPQLDQTITFAFKAKDEFTTVVRVMSEEEQNWGGQYEGATGSISFGTKYSGIYKVIDNNVKIRDISDLTSSQQSAIKFMVSKGYLTLENERFNPEHTFTRYEFAQALVKMFFALDTSLEVNLKDVPKDSSYYPYVASGENYEIIKGFADGTFKGDAHILKEQVISLCARTIADQKGYVYPEHTEDYLKFADAEEIGKWAMNDIALAVQSGLTTAGGSLMPKSEITKAESAEVLYELFNLLYETAPTENVIEMSPTQKTYSILGTLAVLAIALGLIKRFIKRFTKCIMMIACTAAIIITLIIGFKGGF